MCTKINVKVTHKNARAPESQSQHSAELDLYSTEDVIIKAKNGEIIKIGVIIEIPQGIEAGAGVMDLDYRG